MPHEHRHIRSLAILDHGRPGFFSYDEGPAGDGQVRLDLLYTGLSAGTELTFLKGTNPYLHSRWDDVAGRFVPGEYVVGLLAEAFLARDPGAVIVHDPRVVWNVIDVIARAGDQAHQARTGHAFLKQALRDTGAESVAVTEPGEWRLWDQMQDWPATLGVPVDLLADDRFIVSREEFDAHMKDLEKRGQTGTLGNDVNREPIAPADRDELTTTGSNE